MYVTHLEITGELKNRVGEKFKAGKFGEKTIMDEGNGGKMVLLGPPFKFNKENIDDWASIY
jgi:rhamnose transport system substrate-binding protein